MVDYLAPLRARARPAAAVDRDAPARIHSGGARRPHASGRDHRADVDPGRSQRSPRRRSATRRSGSTTSGPASTCRSGSPSCSTRIRPRARCCSRSTGSSPGARRRRRATAARSSSSRAPSRRSTEPASGRFGLGGSKVAELGEGDAAALLAQTLPALRGALLADADGVVLEVDRSPEAVAFASRCAHPR